MINAIRADFYRIFHSKGFYITQLILIALVVLSVFTKSLGSSGIQTDDLANLQANSQSVNWNAYQSVIAMSSMAAFLMYFCLPLFIIILGHDLTRKTYKNQLAVGVSRWSFFISKYVIFLLISFLQFVFYYGFTFLTAWLKYGIGKAPTYFWPDLFRTMGIQFITFQAIFAIGLLVLMLVFSNVAAVIAVIVSGLVTGILVAVFSNITWLRYFDFQTNINLAWMQDMPNHYWLKASLSALLFTVGIGLAAYQFLRNRDL